MFVVRSIALAAAIAFASAHAAPGQAPAPTPPKSEARRAALRDLVAARVDSVFRVAADDGDFRRAFRELEKLFLQAVTFAPEPPTDATHRAIIEAAAGLRLARFLAAAEEDSRKPLLAYLRRHDELARTLVFLNDTRAPARRVARILSALVEAHGDLPGKYPQLAAAICAVHDNPATSKASKFVPPQRRAGARGKGEAPPEPEGRIIDPADLFAFYVQNERVMVFSMRDTPAELLVHMVNTTAEISELRWALARHGGDRSPGNRYDDLTYDTDHFKRDKPKKIDAFPYTLENLRKVGGVCGDQAYYAAHVGKATGVPTAIISGRTAEMSHAWTGVLQQRAGGRYEWQLEEGCFGDYKKIRGSLRDPVAGRQFASVELNMLAATAALPRETREASIAWADAAALTARRSERSRVDPLPGIDDSAPRAGGPTPALALLQRAVTMAPLSARAWAGLAPLARHMTDDDRVKWSEAALRVGGGYPDFALRIISLIAEELEDPAARARAWAWVAKQYTERPDLRAAAMTNQGRALAAAGDRNGAYTCFQQVWQTLTNDASEAMGAITACEALLLESKKKNAVLEMYADAFRRTARPSNTSPGWFAQSNFYQIGAAYAKWLEMAGRTADAQRVRSQIKAGEKKD